MHPVCNIYYCFPRVAEAKSATTLVQYYFSHTNITYLYLGTVNAKCLNLFSELKFSCVSCHKAQLTYLQQTNFICKEYNEVLMYTS